MKFLLSLSIIPLLLLTNVSAAHEKLPLPTFEQENSPLHKYKNPHTEDGYPILAILQNERMQPHIKSDTHIPGHSSLITRNLIIIQNRANELCVFLGHKEARRVFAKDVQYEFEGEAYLDGDIVDVKTKPWSFHKSHETTNAIFKVLRCTD